MSDQMKQFVFGDDDEGMAVVTVRSCGEFHDPDEGFVRRELCRETEELPVLTEETELTAEPPFDELYRHYVEAQVHYANGETARYNSAAGLWNNAFLTYRDYRARTAVPEGGASALRLC